MFISDVVFNVFMCGVDVAVLLGRRRRIVASGGWCAAAVALPVFLDPGFGTMRLAGHALFLHAPALALATAWLERGSWKRWVPPLLSALALWALYVDAYHIEPYRLQIRRHTMAGPDLKAPLRVAIVADLQMEELGEYEKNALRAVMNERPDLILLLGDYADSPDAARLHAELNAYLREIDFGAPRGAFAVEGNTDHRGWERAFEGTRVRVVDRLTIDVGDDVAVTGVGLAVSFDPVHINAEVPARPGRFHIVFGHAPDFAMGLRDRTDLDLLSGGHTHGGQVRIPGFGPILTLSRAPREWVDGIHDVGGAKLVPSRGIGMERDRAPRLRFWCPPEIVIVDVVPPGL